MAGPGPADVQAVHFASCHLGLRYGVWCRITGKANPETEILLGRLQMESELFLWNSVRYLSPFPDISMHDDRRIIEDPDVALVNLCLRNTPILNATRRIDDEISTYGDSSIEVSCRKSAQNGDGWHAGGSGSSSRSDSLRSTLTWRVLSPEVKGEYEAQCGLDPARIRATVECLRPHFADSPALTVIDFWLRISHLQRDSTGFPCIAGDADPGTCPSVGVRTVSELFLQSVGP